MVKTVDKYKNVVIAYNENELDAASELHNYDRL